MLKLGRLVCLLCFVLISGISLAQNLCPQGSNSTKLICLLNDNIDLSSVIFGQPTGAFQNNFQGSFSPLNAAIGRQSALLPLASPSSGITFSWNAAAKTFISSTDSFGPIMGERAETIGKGRVFIGFSYQYFKFDALDGVNLKSMPVVLTQPDSISPNNTTTPTLCSLNGNNSGSDCGYIRDVMRTDNRIDLKVHQFTTFIAYGLTNRIEVSAAIPIENVRMGVFSNATLVDNSQSFVHAFVQTPSCPDPCLQASFSNVKSASGIGDITFRVKGVAWKGERAGLALGVDVRVPTGDQLDFLGAGAAGFRPFVNWSYRSRISPHAVVGYEVNGSSVVAGDITTGAKERLPSQLTYTAGADAWLTKRISAAFDLVGEEVFQAQRSSIGSFTEPAPCTDSNCNAFNAPTVDQSLLLNAGSYNSTSASIGAKIRPHAHLLLTANVSIQLTQNSGLRSKYVPLVGVSYTF
jgi:hypothetical protein